MLSKSSQTMFKKTHPVLTYYQDKAVKQEARIKTHSKKVKLQLNTRTWQTIFTVTDKNELTKNICDDIPEQDLYGIPQAVWDEFIGNLDSDVVKQLQLSEFRHLWKAFNFCFKKSPEKALVLKRASLIASQHFLLPVILSDAGFRPRRIPFLDPPNCTDKGSEASAIIFSLYNASFEPDRLKKISPIYTKPFLRKIACYSDFHGVTYLTFILIHFGLRKGTSYLELQLDEKRLTNAINWLPSSVTEPKEFHHAMALILPFRDCFLGCPRTASIFFINCRGNWLDYDLSVLKEFDRPSMEHYIMALFEDLALRAFLQKCPDYDEQELRVFKNDFKELIINTLSLHQINKLQKHWHRNITVIENKKPPLPRLNQPQKEYEWTPIMDGNCIDDIQIKVLTTEVDLKKHAGEMDHCVGGYANRCRKREMHILEFVDKDNNKSTLQLSGNGRSIVQHYGPRNSKPHPSHEVVAEQLLQMIHKGSIKLNHTKAQGGEKVPYDVDNLVIQEAIYQAYKSTKALPSILNAATYEEMLVKSKIDALLELCGNQMDMPQIAF